MEAELKTMEKNVPKIRTILSSMDNTNITPMEHLHSRQVIRFSYLRFVRKDTQQHIEKSPLLGKHPKLQMLFVCQSHIKT